MVSLNFQQNFRGSLLKHADVDNAWDQTNLKSLTATHTKCVTEKYLITFHRKCKVFQVETISVFFLL